jgi:xyloglucan-specific exo-beta-1,4-glucanase
VIWWFPTSTGKFYRSTDGGHTFTAVSQTWNATGNGSTDLAVNPFTEDDVWLADANNQWHSVDSGSPGRS